jgi:hypothetical protein
MALQNFEIFLESMGSTKTISNKNLVQELSVAMTLINPQFLDRILDLGLKARWTENSSIYISDLKNLLLAKNRLKLGHFVKGVCVEDSEISKINPFFSNIDFNFEEDFSQISGSRIIARNITDKLILPDKLEEQMISSVYWLGPNKTKDFPEDLVVELVDGRQFSLILGKRFSGKKSSSFQTLTDQIIPKEISNLYSQQYLPLWDKLVQTLLSITNKYATSNTRAYLQKFISLDRIPTIGWYEYFDIKHSDRRYQILGEYLRDLDKNVVWLSDLLNLIWKEGEKSFVDLPKAKREWLMAKNIILNSRIIEKSLTESLVRNNKMDIKRLKSGMKIAKGVAKMKLVKTIVEKIGSLSRDMVWVGKSPEDFILIPNRQFFREHYDQLDVLFDYHVKKDVPIFDPNGDLSFLVRLYKDREKLLDMQIKIGFSGVVSEKLKAVFEFTLVDDFRMKTSDSVE